MPLVPSLAAQQVGLHNNSHKGNSINNKDQDRNKQVNSNRQNSNNMKL